MTVFLFPDMSSLQTNTEEKMITWYITDYDNYTLSVPDCSPNRKE